MKVITVIRDNMMAAKEIMEWIKLKDKTYFLDKYLYPAMEEGYVEQLYPENPKHPGQKYMLLVGCKDTQKLLNNNRLIVKLYKL